MNVKVAVEELKKKYPDKEILAINEGEYQEVICEYDPASVHPARSLAIVVAGKTKKHHHSRSTEIYGVLKGELALYINDKKQVLKENEKTVIKPGQIYWAEGNNTWFYTYSTPGWTSKDHILD
jgi:mannose-6-phosphate isomerase-like protein (cupin superfamily)